MSYRIFPACTRGFRYHSHRETFVVFDMEGYSIRDIPHPCLIKEKIKRVMENDGHVGQVDFQAYVAENTLSEKLQDVFTKAGITIVLEQPGGGGKVTKLNRMLVDVLHWAIIMHLCDEPSNVLILSKNIINIEQDPNFSKFRASLERNDFHVALAELGTFLDLDSCVDERTNPQR